MHTAQCNVSQHLFLSSQIVHTQAGVSVVIGMHCVSGALKLSHDNLGGETAVNTGGEQGVGQKWRRTEGQRGRRTGR